MTRRFRIAIGGSAANPTHNGHLGVLRTIIQSNMFDKVFWIPCGNRTDKKDLVNSRHRVAMVNRFTESFTDKEMGIIEVLDDDVRGENTPTIEWMERLTIEYPDADIYWYTGSDSVIPLEKYKGECEIKAQWTRGKELIKKFKFLVLTRKGYPIPDHIRILDQFEVLEVDIPEISSSRVRSLIKEQDYLFEWLLPPQVAAYIKKHRLYGWKGEEDGNNDERR